MIFSITRQVSLRVSLILFLLPFLISCQTRSLSEKGARVAVSPAEPAECQYLGTVEATPGLDMDSAYIQMRNVSGDRGANTLVIDAIRRQGDDIVHHGRAFNCPR